MAAVVRLRYAPDTKAQVEAIHHGTRRQHGPRRIALDTESSATPGITTTLCPPPDGTAQWSCFRACRQIKRCFSSWASLVWYGHPGGDAGRADGEVRGGVPALGRAAAAAAGRGGSPGVGPRRHPRGGEGGREGGGGRFAGCRGAGDGGGAARSPASPRWRPEESPPSGCPPA